MEEESEQRQSSRAVCQNELQSTAARSSRAEMTRSATRAGIKSRECAVVPTCRKASLY